MEGSGGTTKPARKGAEMFPGSLTEAYRDWNWQEKESEAKHQDEPLITVSAHVSACHHTCAEVKG